jgi:hypothetical protein
MKKMTRAQRVKLIIYRIALIKRMMKLLASR